MNGLLGFLSNCLLLGELEIVHEDGFHSQRNNGVAHLPHLRAYTETANMEFSFYLFDMLSCPPSCSITFVRDHTFCGPGDLFSIRKPPHVDARRMKLKTRSMDGKPGFVEGATEIVDATNRRFRSMLTVVLGELTERDALINGINPLYHGFIEALDARFIETLCVEGCALWFYEKSDNVEEALDHLENIKKLILSESAVEPHVNALVPTAAPEEWRCLKLESLVICSRYDDLARNGTMSTLCEVARERKVGGFSLKSITMFAPRSRALRFDPDHIDSSVEEARKWVDRFELVTGEDAMDRDVNDYFLDGLDHLRRDQ